MKCYKFWLSRQRDGNYMLTLFKPTASRVVGLDVRDLYMVAGEPMGIRHLCADGVHTMLRRELEPLQSVQVTLGVTVPDERGKKK